ncbi:MAG TPA: hypothetical protein VLE99_03305 [Candidatus Saccharimonadales bacterium]|nr:hypothetical protein [Candidatus Saccharimonadales bacterium]
MKRILAYLYLPLAALYLYLSVVFPTDQATIARRHLSLAQARLVSLSVAIPLLVIWLLAFYGAYRLKRYSVSIRKHADGPPFMQLAMGMWLLAVYLPVQLVGRALLHTLTRSHPDALTAANIVLTYVGLGLLLEAFIFVSHAARGLAELAKVKSSLRAVYGMALVFIGLSVLYGHVAFTTHGHIPPSNWLVASQQSIPLLLRVVTVMVPYLFMWFIGLLAVYELWLYQRQVTGVFYRQTLRLLSAGLVSVVLVTIGIQFAIATAATLQTLRFRFVLLLVYTLIVLLGVAFVLLGRGVRRLEQLDKA